MPGDQDRERLGNRLRDAYRDVVPTPEERQRHLTNIAGTLPGMRPEPWRRQRGLMEAAVVVTILALVVGGFALWESRDASPSAPETPEPIAGAAITVTATAPAPTATPSSCAETPPEDGQPSVYGSDPLYHDWYRNGDLWISPIAINGVNPALPDTGGRWFTGGMPVAGDWPFGAGDVFTITAERLDGPAEPVSETQSSDAMINSIVVTFPEPGCWELTASVRDMSLTIVIYVLPLSERPDVRQALERRDATLPYPAPESCGPGWGEPLDRFGNYDSAYWIDLDGISVRSREGVLWTNEPAMLDWFPDEWGDIQIEGNAHDNGMSLGYAADYMQRVGVDATHWQSSLLFGTPGCWELTVTIGEVTASVDVWVYPVECRREPGQSVPDGCRPPE